ncbi:MAG: C40 family peptidase [Pedobacter sp.]|jgi:hypothetical protein
MKRLFSFVALLLFIGSYSEAALPDSTIIKRVSELSSQVQKKYAPDRRVEYYQLKQQTAAPLTYKLEVSRPEAAAELKALLNSENLAVVINEEVLPSKDLGEKVYGIANLSVINTRYAPDHAAEMATQSGLGTPMKVLKKERGHYFVRTPDNYLSWTESAGVALMTKTEFENWQTADKVIYTDLFGQAYSEPSESSLPVSDLVAGNIMQVLNESDRFYKISFPDKRIAYISVKKAQPFDQWKNRPDPDADQILKTARNFLGIPYLWGGTSVKGMDCSGFTKTSYFLNGIVLPRDASQQALVGEKVDVHDGDTVSIAKSLKALKPGDLLFFAGNKRTLRVTHTAIYIGNGEFIQAAGLVRINSMIKGSKNYDDFQSRTLVGARRMLTAIGEPEITRINQHPYYQRVINQ